MYLCKGGNIGRHLFVPASCNQLQVSHQRLVDKWMSLTAKEMLDNSGQIQLEAVLRLMYTSTLIHWHAHFWASQHHITHFAVQTFFWVLEKTTVWNLCGFRNPGNQITHLRCNPSSCKWCCNNGNLWRCRGVQQRQEEKPGGFVDDFGTLKYY